MVKDGSSVHFIDFQGGMKGAPQYDVASLLWQAKAKLPEDDAKRLEKDIQAATDASIKSINDHLAHKEKDLLTV